MISNCLIDGTMTAFFKNEFEFDGNTPSYQDSIVFSSIRHSRTVIIPLRGFVLYCSKQGICTANSKYNSPEAVVSL